MILMLSLSIGCAYYNYLYNAKMYYEQGEEQRKLSDDTEPKRGKTKSKRGLSAYDKCIESAGRMLQYYPDSRWEDDALLILAKAYYRTGKYRQSMAKVDELSTKYPESDFIAEGLLWKGMSLLMLNQPDSARILLESVGSANSGSEFQIQANFALAQHYFEESNWDEALDYYTQVVESADDEWLRGQAWLKVGECYQELSRLDEAVRIYEDIIASRSPRRLKLEATLERGVILRELGDLEEALKSFERLLDDAAYLDDFPRIDLQSAITLRYMGKLEEARDRLEKLADVQKRGELATEIQYELGNLLWQSWRDFVNAHKALVEAGRSGKGNVFGQLADSLREETEKAYSFDWKMRFYNSQITSIDSSLTGLREMLPADTLFVDSVKIIIQSDTKSRRRSRGSRDGFSSKLSRMVEKAEHDSDSLAIAEVDSSEALSDSLLGELRERRLAELDLLNLDLAGFHLFYRQDLDSAKGYFEAAVKTGKDTDYWGRAVASLAYIAGVQDDSTRQDSLYRVLVEGQPETPAGIGAAKILGLATTEVVDSFQVYIEIAESAWIDNDDPELARTTYLTAAEFADSTSDSRARAILGAAYISRRILHEDSVANELYRQLIDNFKRSDYGRLAKTRTTAGAMEEEPFEQAIEFVREMPTLPGGIDDLDFIYDEADLFDEPERIYLPDQIDEPPQLITTKEKIVELAKFYHPPTAFNEEISGAVMLEFVVDRLGETSDVEIISEDPEDYEFADAALEVFPKLSYRAGRYRGEKVAVRIRQEIVFEFPKDE